MFELLAKMSPRPATPAPAAPAPAPAIAPAPEIAVTWDQVLAEYLASPGYRTLAPSSRDVYARVLRRWSGWSQLAAGRSPASHGGSWRRC
jgi:hypothetical protein